MKIDLQTLEITDQCLNGNHSGVWHTVRDKSGMSASIKTDHRGEWWHGHYHGVDDMDISRADGRRIVARIGELLAAMEARTERL